MRYIRERKITQNYRTKVMQVNSEREATKMNAAQLKMRT